MRVLDEHLDLATLNDIMAGSVSGQHTSRVDAAVEIEVTVELVLKVLRKLQPHLTSPLYYRLVQCYKCCLWQVQDRLNLLRSLLMLSIQFNSVYFRQHGP